MERMGGGGCYSLAVFPSHLGARLAVCICNGQQSSGKYPATGVVQVLATNSSNDGDALEVLTAVYEFC
jgi:hypothetical protein